ncbi:polysaccharide pyruvyl transferase family protein [Luteimonas sp. TWI662]|uniref:polysaccharide pyruvyl transferase family protein n=1 Tax=Luteimonas sp. TWI662 TaxID=3136789 RepID=UPI00320B9044
MNILLVGTSGHNLGDDALASVLVEQLRSLIPDSKVTVTSVNPGRLQPLGVDELSMDRKSPKGWIAIIQAIRRSDVILLGGGTLIQDALGISVFRGMIPYIWQVTAIAKLLGKPIATVPIGVDELSSSRAPALAKHIFNRCSTVLLRDQKSLTIAQSLVPGNESKFVLSSDPVFFLSGEPLDEPRDRSIVISYVKEKRSQDTAVADVVALVEGVRRQWPDHRVILLSMDTREQDELGVYRAAAAKIGTDNVEVLSPNDYRTAVKIIRRSSLVIAMRLHAMIIALGYTPLVGISRATKTDTLIRESGIYGISISEFSATRILEKALLAISDQGRISMQKQYVDGAAERFTSTMMLLKSKLLQAADIN